MGYYMRYVTTAAGELELATLDSALKTVDPGYFIRPDPVNPAAGELFYGDMLLGEIEINRPGDEIFDEDIADLKELVTGHGSPNEARVLETLDQARAIVAVQAFWQGVHARPTFAKIDPLWDWLFDNFAGLLQMDEEGFYDAHDLILDLNLKI